ncbi:MAG: ABC transporter permease subunit, partial [Gammaproteobacteria bacterium]
MDVIVSQFFTGASTGAVLLLVALGLALTFGQMGVINMAHGEFLMAGAYTAYLAQQVVPSSVSLLVALPLGAALLSGCLGANLEGSCRDGYPLVMQAHPEVRDPTSFRVQVVLWDCGPGTISYEETCLRGLALH